MNGGWPNTSTDVCRSSEDGQSSDETAELKAAHHVPIFKAKFDESGHDQIHVVLRPHVHVGDFPVAEESRRIGGLVHDVLSVARRRQREEPLD